jgi:two-component system CheB/CheR fusion protein
LRQTQENLSAFFEHSPLGLFWVTPDGHIQRTNKTGADLLGCLENEAHDRRISEFWAYADQARQALRQLASGGVLQNYRARLRRKDGAIRHVLIEANGLWERGRLLYSRWFVRDVTQVVELERAILGAIESERQRLGQDLHDDLCQQLTGIEFLSQSLVGQLRQNSRKQAASAEEIAAMIRDAITRTRELSRGLAPMTVESGGLQEALAELAQRSRKLYQIDCRFRRVKPGLNLTGTSAIHLYRIAQEAVGNAIKHGKAKRIDIGLVENGNDLVLSVRDSGIGLPAKLPARAGMGLRVMQHRAGIIGGTLDVHAGHHGGTSVVCSVRDYQLKSNQENSDETQKRAK